jgi:hypothetical protein
MKSDYYFIIDHNTLCIVDRDEGGVSVTNNAEAVLDEIKELLLPHGLRMPPVVIYCDSEGMWDGMEYVDGTLTFYPLRKRDMAEAEELARKRFVGKKKGAEL